jgi:hypothetical protein
MGKMASEGKIDKQGGKNRENPQLPMNYDVRSLDG